MRYTVLLLLISVFIFYSCSNKKEVKNNNGNNFLNTNDSASYLKENSENVSIKTNASFTLKDFYSDNKVLNNITDSIFNSLNEKDRIAQMIVTSAGSLGKPKQTISALITRKEIGGVLLLGGSKKTFTEFISYFKKVADSSKCLPLIFSTDAEPSLINLKISGLEKITPTNTIKSDFQSTETANKISRIISDIGFNQNYAPVCDLSFNKEIIGVRSFGGDENKVIKLASKFIKTTQDNNIIATAKHFPGHGNVSGDTHKGDVIINGDLKELNVFKEIIKSGVISMMVGHLIISDNTKYSTNGLPSTLSRNIVTGLLKKEMGFKGIVITDGMNMKAVSKYESPSLKAVLAGCDMILMPSDEAKLINSIISELSKNNELRKQIEESVKKIIRVKICLGLFKNKLN